MMFLATSVMSSPSLPILSPSLLVERQAGFSQRCILSPSTSCMCNEMGEKQRVTHTSTRASLSSPVTQSPTQTIHNPKLPTVTPSQVGLIAWKPKILCFGFRQVSGLGESLLLLQQHWLPGSSQSDKSKGKAEDVTDLRW